MELTIDGRLCASCKPPSLPNRQPCRSGPYRNSGPPRATATATSPSERTLCSDSIYSAHRAPVGVGPGCRRTSLDIYSCQSARLATNYPCRRRCMLLPLLGTSPVPSFPLAGPTCPLYIRTGYWWYLKVSNAVHVHIPSTLRTNGGERHTPAPVRRTQRGRGVP